MSKPTYDESKQTMWETWFVISIVLLGVMLYTGMSENSVEVYPNWLYFAIFTIINFIVCLVIGMIKVIP